MKRLKQALLALVVVMAGIVMSWSQMPFAVIGINPLEWKPAYQVVFSVGSMIWSTLFFVMVKTWKPEA